MKTLAQLIIRSSALSQNSICMYYVNTEYILVDLISKNFLGLYHGIPPIFFSNELNINEKETNISLASALLGLKVKIDEHRLNDWFCGSFSDIPPFRINRGN